MSSDNPTSMLPDVLGSATAGIISRVVTHPLDTVSSLLLYLELCYDGNVMPVIT